MQSKIIPPELFYQYSSYMKMKSHGTMRWSRRTTKIVIIMPLLNVVTVLIPIFQCFIVEVPIIIPKNGPNKRQQPVAGLFGSATLQRLSLQTSSSSSFTSEPYSEEQQEAVASVASSSTATTSTTNSKNDRHLAYSFFDEAYITVRAGSGGQGSNSYTVRKRTTNTRSQQQRGKPDGGNGGRGGHVILRVDKNLNTLANIASQSSSSSSSSSKSTTSIPFFRAEHGQEGRGKFQNGRSGNDVIIRVPPGIIVQEERIIFDAEKNVSAIEWIEMGTLTLYKDHDEQPSDDATTTSSTTSSLIVAHGGAGGEGTGVWANGIPSVPRRSPTAGERKNLKLTLKLIADVAVIGVPNAGKSTLLAAVTRAKPKIANYPFSTIIPNLGVAWIPPSLNDDDQQQKQQYDNIDDLFQRKPLVLCDVPGLVAGAAQGVGLGHAFLRHVERCHVLLHVVDATSEDPIADYRMLNLELMEYGSGKLATLPQIVVVNKADALVSSSLEDEVDQQLIRRSRVKLEEQLRSVMPHSRLLWISAKNRQGVDELLMRLSAFVEKVKTSNAEQERGQ